MDINENRLEAQDLNQQAVLLIQAGNLEAAKTKLDKAIDLEPMLVDSYRNYGDLQMAAQSYKEAKAYYKKALLVEKVPAVYFLYGNACFMNDEIHEGLEYYNHAISAGYDTDEMMFFMGMAYEHLNDDRMALRYFQRACTKNPSRPDYIIKKIAVLVRLDMLDSAEGEIDRLLQIAPEMFDGYHMKTQFLIHKGNIDDAVRFAEEAIKRFPADVDLMYDYVKCVSLTKNFAKALDLIDRAKQLKYFADSRRQFLVLEAQIAAESGNYDRAEVCCESCIDTEDGEFFAGEARFLLMNFAMAKQNFEKVLTQAEALVKHFNKDSYYYAALYYKANSLTQLGRFEEARASYKEAVSIYRLATLNNPSAIDVYLYRAMALKDIEEFDKALEILDFVIGVNAEIAEVYALKAEIYKSLGKHSQAEEQREKAYALKPELRPINPEAGE